MAAALAPRILAAGLMARCLISPMAVAALVLSLVPAAAVFLHGVALTIT